MKALLDQATPGFSLRLVGMSPVDLTKRGIGKAHGIRELREVLSMAIAEMAFAGDAVLPSAIDRLNDLGTPDRFDVYCGMADNRIGVARLDLPEHLLLLSAPAAGGEPTTGGQE